MKHIKNKRFLLYGSALLAAIVALGATIAYSHDSSVLPNEFNVGAHEVVMSETFVSPSNWKPGDETEKTLTVRNNSGSDIRVRVKYDEEWR
ncbi:hypothetical protein J6X09_02035, partial [Candidatus Saccharibacteria bacterium]|nr:hypothetical protein [Candidatus Saccharibacteria bacterium]